MAKANIKILNMHNPMAKFVSQEQNATWVEGKVEIGKHNYFFQAHVYEEPVENGIDGGKIDRLAIFERGLLVADYDKGWGIFPVKPYRRMALDKILACFNKN